MSTHQAPPPSLAGLRTARLRRVLPLHPDRWRRVMREFTLIVVGALVALAGNSWWEFRQDREREGVYLRHLVTDVRQTERNLLQAIAEERRADAGARAIFTALQREGPLPPDSLRAWVALRPVQYADPRVVMGTITALQQSGDLRLLRSDSLRVAVSAYAAAMEGEWAEFSRWVDVGLDHGRQFTVPGIRRVREVPLGFEGLEEALFRWVMVMRDDPDARVAFYWFSTAAINRLLYLERMLEVTQRLRRAVEAEIGGGAGPRDAR